MRRRLVPGPVARTLAELDLNQSRISPSAAQGTHLSAGLQTPTATTGISWHTVKPRSARPRLLKGFRVTGYDGGSVTMIGSTLTSTK